MEGTGSTVELDASVPAQATQDIIAQFANQAVLKLLQKRFDQLKDITEAPTLLDGDDVTVMVERSFAGTRGYLSYKIALVYRKFLSGEEAFQVADVVVSQIKEKFGKTERNEVSSSEEGLKEQLQIAFTKTTYVGNAQVAFEKYLRRCWRIYSPKQYKAPYVAVVQSSGFGKSRMLFELARKAERSDGSSSNLRVLYSCVCFHRSTGYPVATARLRDWLFQDESIAKMASRLKAMYAYAIANWDNVQAEWINLFTEVGADAAVRENLEDVLKNKPDKCTVPESSTKQADIVVATGVVVNGVGVDVAGAAVGAGVGGVNDAEAGVAVSGGGDVCSVAGFGEGTATSAHSDRRTHRKLVLLGFSGTQVNVRLNRLGRNGANRGVKYAFRAVMAITTPFELSDTRYTMATRHSKMAFNSLTEREFILGKWKLGVEELGGCLESLEGAWGAWRA